MFTPFSDTRREAGRAILLLLALALFGCTRSANPANAPWQTPANGQTAAPDSPPASSAQPEAAPAAYTPTPDPPHDIPGLRQEAEEYVVQPGDTLMRIAQHYNVTVEQIAAANDLPNPDLLEVGQVLQIPAPPPLDTGPGLKIIPDSELVYGPSSADFDITGFIRQQGGYLASYREEVDGEMLSGAQIVARIAQNYSLNPRLLLAVLEHQSGWVTNPNPDPAGRPYPIGLPDPRREGLYRQLAWAADRLNRGYYLWRVEGIGAWVLPDGSLVPINPTINAGTAGVQQLFASLYSFEEWQQAVSESGLLATFTRLFGYPFALTYEPLIPASLVQPELRLPFPAGQLWSFTGGPHGGWDSGSAWAALDFAPPGEAAGCVQSDEWVTAMADGLIVRTGNGAVVQDLDGDGLEQTGWTILYMHVESRERVQTGTRVQAGDRIGHPSCEGGIATGSHVHVARRYNGEWIPADQPELPFVMDGWVASGAGTVYDGYLTREGQIVEAYGGNSEINKIQR